MEIKLHIVVHITVISIYSVYIKYIRGKRMHLCRWIQRWRTSLEKCCHIKPTFKYSLITSRVAWDAADSPIRWSHTKIDYSDTVSIGLFLRVITLFCHFKHPDNCVEVNERLMDGLMKQKFWHPCNRSMKSHTMAD